MMDRKSNSVIFRVFYVTVHFLFTLYELLQIVYISVSRKLLELYHELAPVNKSKTFLTFEKLPNHLTVLLGSEEPSLQDLSNLILWCLAAQITFVSFYDHKGILRKNEEKLIQLVKEQKKVCDHVIWHSTPSFYKNGFSGRKIHVKVLSGSDGKAAIVDLVRKKRSDFSDVTIENINVGLQQNFEFPDPDLGVCCGTFCLFGYPPWQIRLTEFLHIKSHHKLQFNTFVDLLYRFNKCEQRYGK